MSSAGRGWSGSRSTGKRIRAALRTYAASRVDLWKFGAGHDSSLHALRPEYSREDLVHLREFEAPIVFMLDRHDRHVPSVSAAEHFDTVRAPCTRLVWFEESAHIPPFAEPARFVEEMVETVLPLARGGCPAPGPGPA